MRYCFLSVGTWERNAAMVRLRELGTQLSLMGHEVCYVLDDHPFNRGDLALPAGARLEFVAKPNSARQWSGRRAAIRKLAPDFVHVLTPHAKAFAALVGTRVKVVGDFDEWPAMRNHRWPRSWVERFLDWWLRRRAHRVIVTSRFLQREYERLYGISSTYVPYAAYLPALEDGTSPFSEPTAVYVGTLLPIYDHDLIVDAARISQARGAHPAIKMLGRGPDLEKWRETCREAGLTNVEFTGYVSTPEMWRYLRHAHVLLLPIRENLQNLARCPSKSYAYAQSGREVLANRVGEVEEVFQESATWIDATPQAFADAIEAALSRPAREVKYDLERLTWAQRARSLVDALQAAPISAAPVKTDA